jgi:DNA-binding FadR family transcriptional regulator
MTARAPERPGWTFQPIVGARAHERVVEQIALAIRSGAVRVGERLPRVGEMADAMGVSRPTVGEAVRVLSSHGVVEARRGVNGGVTVVDDTVRLTGLGLPDVGAAGLRELLETRRPIELALARLAAERADDQDLAGMEEAIARLDAHSERDDGLRLHFDHLFHYRMGRAARSALLAHYQHQVLERITALVRDYFVETEDPARVAELHRRTLDALRSRDPERVERAMDEHLSDTEEALRR